MWNDEAEDEDSDEGRRWFCKLQWDCSIEFSVRQQTCGRKAYPVSCSYLYWDFGDCFVKNPERQTITHSHDSAPRMGPLSGVADSTKKNSQQGKERYKAMAFHCGMPQGHCKWL